jgi:hypothetical protein
MMLSGRAQSPGMFRCCPSGERMRHVRGCVTITDKRRATPRNSRAGPDEYCHIGCWGRGRTLEETLA